MSGIEKRHLITYKKKEKQSNLAPLDLYSTLIQQQSSRDGGVGRCSQFSSTDAKKRVCSAPLSAALSMQWERGIAPINEHKTPTLYEDIYIESIFNYVCYEKYNIGLEIPYVPCVIPVTSSMECKNFP